ncbi:putative acid phosphatase SPBC4.06 [Exophiala dermatitidis]
MTSIEFRPPYSQEELDRLYPKDLELRLVQVLLRHGERAPVSARFSNAGLPAYWPYCNAAQRLRSVALTPEDDVRWNSLQWRRRLERFGHDDGPVIAAGPVGEVDGICQLGELTDKGRETTYELGRRLRHLYVDQLKFMPALISNADLIYLRATPLPRALESLQETFWGMYPLNARTAAFPAPTIVTRTPADETLFPNDGNCRRFAQLSRAFAQRTADRWNDTDDMKYLTKLIGKWMPENSNKKVAVDSHPRLSGIMDTINSTLAHGPETRLPKEFYDAKARAIIDRIGVEEWFSGYQENREYRMLGIGGLIGDIVERMTSKIEGARLSINEIGGENGRLGLGRGGEKGIRFAMSGCHDTTLAGVLSSLGAFQGEKWPPYTSHIAFELFRQRDPNASDSDADADFLTPAHPPSTEPKASSDANRPGLFASFLGLRSPTSPSQSSDSEPKSTPAKSPRSTASTSMPPKHLIARTPYKDLSESQKARLENYYVRVRFNDRVMKIPACAIPGNNYQGDETMCTFEAFKRVADGYVPRNWKAQCGENLDKPIASLDSPPQPAGQIDDGF